MQIQNRKLPVYVILNCLTLGIYGFIVNQQIGNEINALCKGDGEKPALSYAGAIMIRGISTFLGVLTGLILGLVLQSAMDPLVGFIPGMGGTKAIAVFASILVCEIAFTLIGSILSGIYLNYWWYKQANRLKLNANRFDLVVKERGTDMFLFRTVLNILFIPITVIIFALSLFIPFVIAWLITLANSIGADVFAVVFITVCAIPLMLFGPELTTGGLFSFFFVTKNINRYAAVYRNGARPFDPMAYEYYPSVNNHYIRSLPGFVSGAGVAVSGGEVIVPETDQLTGPMTDHISTGSLIGMSGTCAGYNFEISPGEEIIIGKDASEASVMIDPSYKEISRKHLGVSYDVIQDVYLVTDYSSNGTWANGQRLQRGVRTTQRHGTVLKLATDKNTFRLN